MFVLFEIILTMGVAWSISGIIHFSRINKKRRTPDMKYAIVVYTIFLLTILDNLLRPTIIPMYILHHIYIITRVSYLLIGPALLLYVNSLLISNYTPNYKSLIHFIPALISMTYILIEPSSIHPKIIFNEETIESGLVSLSHIDIPHLFWDVMKNMSRIIYSIIIIYKINRKSRSLEYQVSDLNSINTLKWLKYIVIFYTTLFLFDTLIDLFFREDILFVQIISAADRSIPAVIFVFVFSHFSKHQTNLDFETIKPKPGIKYEKSGISENEANELYNRLNSHILEHKTYLNSELTLDQLAEETKISRYKLSVVINKVAKKKFYSYINGFRLERFKEIIEKDLYPNFTILSIAMECGFRSSSSFYNLIKKKTGMTPKTYVKSLK